METVLKAFGFIEKRVKGSHAQGEGSTRGQRRIVTVDHLKSRKEKYGPFLLNKMIAQSGLAKDEFYGGLP